MARAPPEPAQKVCSCSLERRPAALARRLAARSGQPGIIFMFCVGVGAGQPASWATRTIASLVSK